MIWDASTFWWSVAAAVMLIGAASVANAYRGALGRRSAQVAAGLKMAVLLVIGVCLAGPLLQRTRVVPQANDFVILIDDSLSQSLPIGGDDRPDAKSRGTRVRELLSEPNRSWLETLSRQFRVRSYEFDTAVQPLPESDGLGADGSSSRMYRSLHDVLQRYAARPLAGVLLLSDGAATDLPTDVDIAALPPVYPVVWQDTVARPDVAVRSMTSEESLFEGAPARITVDVAVENAAGTGLLVTLVDEGGMMIDTRSIPAEEVRSRQSLSFEVPPRTMDRQVFSVEVSFSDAAFRDRELTALNNRRSLVLPAQDREYRVLYVAGRPNWEFKFLRRAIEKDEQIELVGLIRIAQGRRSIDWRSRGSGAANTLFRGFDGDTELAAQYDEPVLVRLNTSGVAELAAGFPTEATELFQYDGIILDDLEADFFQEQQLDLIEQFVSQRGGGLMMLGGAESFSGGDYARTPLAAVLPLSVPIERAPSAAAPLLHWDLTREGWHTPWARLRESEKDERVRLSEMPPFRVLNRLSAAKPGAMLIAETVDDQGRRYPAMAAQRFGEGRSMAVAVGDLWRWQIRREATEATDDEPRQYWRQLLRWLVTSTPERLSVGIAVTTSTGSSSRQVAVDLRDDEYQPLPFADVEITWSGPDGANRTQTAVTDHERPGRYTVPFPPAEQGVYDITATTADPVTGEELTGRKSWVWQPAADELARTSTDRDALTELASKTGGAVVDASQLSDFVDGLPSKSAPVVEQLNSPLWHYSGLLVALLAALSAEWFFRKRRGWR